MYKSVYVGFSFNHHGSHTGYNQIKKYLNYNKVIDCQSDYNLLQSILIKKTIFSGLFFLIFGSRLWWVEVKLIFYSITNPNKLIFHLIYGENIYKYLGYFKFGNKIALTLHQPPDFFENIQQKKFLKLLNKVDKLIVMSEDLEVYFKCKFPNKDVKYIPHGLDTSYFKPCGTKKNQILLIGNWLRDFEFASKVFSQFELYNENITIKIVTNNENYKYFTHNKVKCYSSIDDEKLLEMYQESKVVFLPLKQFTANNALLEANSCGARVVVATNSLFNENIDNSPVLYVNNEVEKVYFLLKDVVENYNSSDLNTTRKFIVDNYCWLKVSMDTQIFLNE